MQIFAIVVSLAIAAVGIALFVKAIRSMIATIKIGQPAVNRSDDKGARWANMLKETLAHTRMLQWTAVGIGHWFIFVGFGLLFFTLLTAFGQLFDPHFALPVIGHFFLYEWVSEFFTVVMVIAILAFIGYRVTRPKERERGTRGRFYGSTMWQAYFVEAVILGVGLCILALRGAEYAIAPYGEHPDQASALHFPFTAWIGGLLDGLSEPALATFIYLVAMLKIVISFTWMIVLSQNTTMGVAWHRFTAWFNIWFKRRSDGGTALGGLQPMMAGGQPIDFENIDELDEETALGVGKVEDFSWKGILDFTSCTECGRCQSQCPAWNTEKPLSPKLLITNLRDHAYAKAPYLLAGSEEERTALPAEVLAEAERPLVGETEGDWAWMPEGGAVIDSDVLWSCTSCGACVQQCPVDIEHVDHIVDMRRYQILVESNFPAELNGLFKGLENKGNPWNMSPNARLEWAQGLPFDVKVVGEDIEDLDEVDWLFWVGCAGAYEDRAKKTTRAVAELLDMAGVSFGVLGNGETCTGDPARRAGNEFVFQGLATQNAETFKEMKVKKVVSTCAHCFNTLKNEYSQFGVELEVVHHTQLLNRLVREGKLTPVATNGAPKRSLTYHDPCYLGRHNQVYSPPRELLSILPDAEVKEMPRNSERSFCCGAGGARMWMEEKIGERINLNRTTEAVETGADQIATGCPFCRVMLSDGLTAKQAEGSAREEVEVLDVAQLLLASVKGESRTPVPAGAAAKSGGAGASAKAAGAGAAAGTAVADKAATKAEPSAGDATQTENTVTEPEAVGANAAATEETGPGGRDQQADQLGLAVRQRSRGGGRGRQDRRRRAERYDEHVAVRRRRHLVRRGRRSRRRVDGGEACRRGSTGDDGAEAGGLPLVGWLALRHRRFAVRHPGRLGAHRDRRDRDRRDRRGRADRRAGRAGHDRRGRDRGAHRGRGRWCQAGRRVLRPASSRGADRHVGGEQHRLRRVAVRPCAERARARQGRAARRRDRARDCRTARAGAGRAAEDKATPPRPRSSRREAEPAGAKTETPATEGSISSAGSLFDLAPSEPEPTKAEPAEQVDAPAPTEAADEKAETEPEQAEPVAEDKADAPEATATTEQTDAAPQAEPAGAKTETPTTEGSISSAGSLFDLAPSEPEPAKAEPAQQVDAQPTTEAADENEASEPEAQPEATSESDSPEEGTGTTAPEPTSDAEPDEDTGTATSAGQASATSNGSAPAQSSGATHEPKRPEGGIDETKSLFDL